MMPSKKNFIAFVFTFLLLFFSCIIRSGVIVDKSFLPRFFSLSLLLLISFPILFRKGFHCSLNIFTIALMLFYLWNLLSISWAISFAEAMLQSQLIFTCVVVYQVISRFAHENVSYQSIFIKTLLLVLLFSFVLAFYKMASLDFYDPYKMVSISANNNLYSGFLLLSLPLVLAGYSIFRGFWKYLALGVAVAAVFFIVIIQSRAAYLGLFVALCLTIPVLFLKYSHVFTRRNILSGVIAFTLLISALFVFYLSLDQTRRSYFSSKVPVWSYFRGYDDTFAEKLLKKREMKASNTQTGAFDFSEAYYENANLRIIFWKKSFGLIRTHPLEGAGAGSWRLAVPSIREPVNPEHTLKNYTYSQPHNEWIGIVAELGIVGFLLSLFIFFIPVGIVLCRIVFSTRRYPLTALLYSVFIMGFYLFSAFDFPFKRVEHNVILFSMFAFLFHQAPLPQLQTDLPVRPLRFLPGILPHWQGIRRLLSRFVSWVFILLLLLSVLIASARLRGEYFTLKLFRDERRNDRNVIHYCRLAENAFYRITPNTLPVAWFEGVAHYRLGHTDTAAICFKRALGYTPFEVRVLNDFGISCFGLKKNAEAKSALLQCIAIDPFFDDAKFNLGAIHYFNGARDSALYYITRCRNSMKKQEFLNELETLAQ